MKLGVFKQERWCPNMGAGCLSARLPVCLLLCVRPPSWPWSMTEEWWSGPTLALLQGEKRNTEHVMMEPSVGNTPVTSPVCVCLCFRAYIANRVTDKLTRIHDKIYCCRSALLLTMGSITGTLIRTHKTFQNKTAMFLVSGSSAFQNKLCLESAGLTETHSLHSGLFMDSVTLQEHKDPSALNV